MLLTQQKIRKFQPFIPEHNLPERPKFISHLPLDLEIGCGVGYHPIQYALSHPQRNLIAIEHTANKFAKFMGRVKHHQPLDNLYPIHGNAISWIAKHIKKEELQRCFILYPNPYPKPSQRNRRWYAMPFMGFLIERLQPGGTITLATNIETYFLEAQTYFTDFWQLKIKESYLINSSFTPSFTPRTHFEKKYLNRGQNCYNLVVIKN